MRIYLFKTLSVLVALTILTIPSNASAQFESEITCCENGALGSIFVRATRGTDFRTMSGAALINQSVLDQLTFLVPESMITSTIVYDIEVLVVVKLPITGDVVLRSFPLAGEIKPGEKWKDIVAGMVVQALVASSDFNADGVSDPNTCGSDCIELVVDGHDTMGTSVHVIVTYQYTFACGASGCTLTYTMTDMQLLNGTDGSPYFGSALSLLGGLSPTDSGSSEQS